MKSIGNRILQKRQLIKFSQKKLGKSVGVSQVTINYWENDTYEPKSKHILLLAKTLQCSVIWLLTGEDNLATTLTKREHFAGLAMQGLLSNGASGSIKKRAEWAVNAADALIKELAK